MPSGTIERFDDLVHQSLGADRDSDLLVLGCYGHSRLREWMRGGATRTILHSMTVPVVMAH